MTWKDFKQQAEDAGVQDTDEISLIDVGWPFSDDLQITYRPSGVVIENFVKISLDKRKV